MKQAKQNKEQGFTLLELMAVVAILGIFSGILIPRVHQSLAQQELRSVGKQLANDIRYIQQLAISEGVFCDIRFYRHTNPQRYRIYQGNTLIATKEIPTTIKIEYANFPNVSLVPTIRFRYSGTPSSGGTVEFSNSYGKRIRVITTPVTARVRIEEL